eukprot:3221991-Prymnesium_polylepis.1
MGSVNSRWGVPFHRLGTGTAAMIVSWPDLAGCLCEVVTSADGKLCLRQAHSRSQRAWMLRADGVRLPLSGDAEQRLGLQVQLKCLGLAFTPVAAACSSSLRDQERSQAPLRLQRVGMALAINLHLRCLHSAQSLRRLGERPQGLQGDAVVHSGTQGRRMVVAKLLLQARERA